jgi:Fe-S cluster assembly iron-binding protein IscA
MGISAEPIDDKSMTLDLSLAPSPDPDDAIVAQEGTHDVFVDQAVEPLLDDKTLDAAVQADKVTFTIVEQGQDWSGNGQPKRFDPRNFT